MNESAEILSPWRRSRVVCQETDCSLSAAILGQECVTCVQIRTLSHPLFWLYKIPIQATFYFLLFLVIASFHFRQHKWSLSQHIHLSCGICTISQCVTLKGGFWVTRKGKQTSKYAILVSITWKKLFIFVCPCISVWKTSLCANPSSGAIVFMFWLPYHLAQPHKLDSYTCLKEPVMDKEEGKAWVRDWVYYWI